MDIAGYQFDKAGLNPAHDYLLPAVLRILEAERRKGHLAARVFEVGFGNGAVANELDKRGYEVIGVDPSKKGVQLAMRNYSRLRLSEGSTEDELMRKFGTYPFVLSLEVVEHVYAPRQFAGRIFELLEPGGVAIVSTPYHGYVKNLAVALLGQCDRHYTALWDNGHIKFWSMKTLTQLLAEAGFHKIEFFRVGRIPVLAKSMIAVARRR